MKSTLIFAAMLAMSISSFAFEPNVNEKVLNLFNKTFTSAEHVKWDEYKDYYSVRFIHNGIRTIVNYDKGGNMMSSIRYYHPDMLPLNIIGKMKKDYPAASLFGVTEITVNNDVAYFVKLEDKKHWITLKVSPSCDTELYERYKKG